MDCIDFLLITKRHAEQEGIELQAITIDPKSFDRAVNELASKVKYSGARFGRLDAIELLGWVIYRGVQE